MDKGKCMKRVKYMTAAMLLVAVTAVLSGCNNNKILNKLSDKGYFSNSYDNAILQTDIASKISSHFTNNSGTRKKAILITIDGFRAEGLEYMMGNDLGMLSIAKEGGLYWTKPANLDTKANIDIGVNFLSIVTGQEPSTFNVLKKTDAKRETPYSVMTTMSEKYRVKFLTDNKNYIDTQLAAEFDSKLTQQLSFTSCMDLNALRTESINNLDANDFIVAAVSNPYLVADGNFKMSNSTYLSALLHLNYYLADMYDEIKARVGEDWLIIVATTCGGKTKLALGNEEGNILTFMITNKKM